MKKPNTLKFVEGIRPDEDQLKAIIAFYNEKNSIPGNKIQCVDTLKLSVCVHFWRDKQIAKYGGIENFVRTYTCREVKKALKATQPAAPKQSKKQKEAASVVIPQIPDTRGGVLKGEAFVENSKIMCQDPSVHLDNGHSCDPCKFGEACENSLNKKTKAKATTKKAVKVKAEIKPIGQKKARPSRSKAAIAARAEARDKEIAAEIYEEVTAG